jgi:hypothetical protein
VTHRERLTRRQLTVGLGASLLCAPFLDLLAKPARAASGKFADRLVLFFSPNGTVPRLWAPAGSGTNFSFPPGSILEPLAAHIPELVVCDGIDFIGVDNHEPGMRHMLTAGGTVTSVGAGASVDQFIASQVGGTTRFQSLEFGVQTSAWGAQAQTRMSYSAPGVFVSPEDSPKNAFKRMFGGLVPAAPGGASGGVDRLAKRRKSILDLVRADIATLRSRVGKEEQHKLDQHLEALRQTERGLVSPGSTGAGAGASCAAPAAPIDLDYASNENFPAIGKAQMDLLVLSLACGMTKVASIQWSHTVGPPVFSWVGVSEGHHDLSHKDDSNTQGVADFVKTERWYATQFGYLLDALKATPDPSGAGTLLDTSLVVWAKELGDSRLHVGKGVPFILAGGANGYLKTGRYLKLGHVPSQKLLVSICRGMGLTNDSFGDPSGGTGPLTEIAG